MVIKVELGYLLDASQGHALKFRLAHFLDILYEKFARPWIELRVYTHTHSHMDM